MREIKFRAWQNVKHIMSNPFILGEETYTSSDDGIHYRNDNEAVIITYDLRDEYILMQYTGLKDKNGKEIYEGDIVKLKNSEYESIKFKEFTDLVIFTDGCFCFNDAIENSEATYWPLDNIEVIGNIYENPELIKEV